MEPPPDILAVALVVESSIAVAAEWPLIILNYVTNIVKRLGDANPGYRLRIGFVTYATASTFPSPVLCKRFFTEYPAVMREMREDPAKLGIGQTNSGGTRGMAALEGLVAAIELFDILHISAQPARQHVNHIFHVAASTPDTSIHPQWNDSPSLDSVTWEDLPAELKARKISINSIILHQNLPRFADLHSAVTQGTSKDMPWFPVRLGHTILLGLPSPAPLQKSAKRAGEPHPNERTPDPKRLRLASQSALEASPKTGAPNTPSNVPKPSPVPPHIQVPSHISSQLPSQPPAQPSSAQTHSLPPNFSQYQNLLNNLNLVEEQLRTLRFSMQSAHSAGNTALAESLAQECVKKTKLQEAMKRTAMAFATKIQALAAATNQNQNQNKSNQGQAQIQVQGQAQQSQPTGGPTASLPNTFAALQSPQLMASIDASPSVGPHLGVDGRPDQQIFTQLMHHRSLSGSSTSPPGGVVPSAAGRVMSSPVVQMQKLNEQTQKTRPDSILSQVSGQGQGTGVVQQAQTQSGPSSSEGMGQPNRLWQGSLTWSGTNPNGEKKAVTVHVVANTPNLTESQVDTWPPAMSLAPIRSVSMSDLRVWLARFKPIICTFAPQTHGVPDVHANAANLKTLVSLLNSKNCYASASWTRPSGEQGSNALFLPTPHGLLIGAVFPVTGLPELPKPPSNPGLPAEVLARMQQMPPDQMELVLMQWRKHREGSAINQGAPAGASGGTIDLSNHLGSFGNSVNLSHLQQQQQPDLDGGLGTGGPSMFGGNGHPSNNYGGGLNMMGIGLGQPQNMMGLSATLPRPVSVSGGGVQSGVGSGLGPGNVSYEMMKSFIQRGGVNAGTSG